jgi:hypothetical protein
VDERLTARRDPVVVELRAKLGAGLRAAATTRNPRSA